MISYDELISHNPDSKGKLKIAKALSKLSEAEVSRQIFNVEYQEIKGIFNNAHEYSLTEIFRVLRKKHGYEDADLVPTAIQELWYLNKARPSSTIKKIYLSQELNENPYALELLEYLILIDSVVKRLDALKDFIIKGRKPSENASPRFEPQRAKLDTIHDLKLKFEEFCNPLRNEIKSGYSEHYANAVKEFALKSPDEQRTVFKNFSFLFNANRELLTDNNLLDAIENRSNLNAIAIVEEFILKNISKLGSIIDRKGTYKNIEVISAYSSKGKLNSSLKFYFDNGSSFIVKSKIVIVYSRTVFSRYPTTFHDILDSNNVFHKTQSEEWMNTIF